MQHRFVNKIVKPVLPVAITGIMAFGSAKAQEVNTTTNGEARTWIGRQHNSTNLNKYTTLLDMKVKPADNMKLDAYVNNTYFIPDKDVRGKVVTATVEFDAGKQLSQFTVRETIKFSDEEYKVTKIDNNYIKVAQEDVSGMLGKDDALTAENGLKIVAKSFDSNARTATFDIYDGANVASTVTVSENTTFNYIQKSSGRKLPIHLWGVNSINADVSILRSEIKIMDGKEMDGWKAVLDMNADTLMFRKDIIKNYMRPDVDTLKIPLASKGLTYPGLEVGNFLPTTANIENDATITTDQGTVTGNIIRMANASVNGVAKDEVVMTIVNSTVVLASKMTADSAYTVETSSTFSVTANSGVDEIEIKLVPSSSTETHDNELIFSAKTGPDSTTQDQMIIPIVGDQQNPMSFGKKNGTRPVFYKDDSAGATKQYYTLAYGNGGDKIEGYTQSSVTYNASEGIFKSLWKIVDIEKSTGPTGVEEQQVDMTSPEMLVYPNPIDNGRTPTAVVNGKDRQMWLNLYDINGKLVKNVFNGFVGNGRNKIGLNIGNISSGVYFLRERGNNGAVQIIIR